ncbi:MAG TPA: hypothetical protein VNG91_08510 [Terriglobia bacterium]|nr:hypothetical protein [Terriglobia bacterium]
MIQKNPRWLLPLFLAGAFMAAPVAFAHGNKAHQSLSASAKKDRRQHNGELLYQRQRVKASGKSVRAEARQSGHRNMAPKAEQHHVSKAHQHSFRQTPNLRSARKQSRRRRTVHHPVKTN